MAAMGVELPSTFITFSAFLLSSAEFAIGVFNITGCFRRTTAWLSLGFMCIMLPLTGWIALTDPVADCGCFGDAYIVSNTATFWKNVGLTFCAVWNILYPKLFPAIITPALQWTGATATFAFIYIVSFIGYFIQPLADYRPYPVGSEFLASEQYEQDDTTYEFIYSRNGQTKSFTIDNLPDESEGWEFVDRKAVGTTANPTNGGFTLWDASGVENMTEVESKNNDSMLYLLVAEPEGVEAVSSWQINLIKDNAQKAGTGFIAVMAADSTEIASWKDLTMSDYPIYRAEDTSIKEVARGNPALVYTSGNKIKWKSALSGINPEELFKPDVNGVVNLSDNNGRIDTTNWEHILITIYVSIIGFISIIGHTNRLPLGFSGYKPRLKKLIRGDKAPRAK